MEKSKTGFREIEHTADLEIKVWGPDLPALFRQAAQGLYHLAQLKHAQKQEDLPTRTVHLKGIDWEDLLVAFLDELLYLLEEESLTFECPDLKVNADYTLKGRMCASPVLSQSRDIKAVTYHNLNIRKTRAGFEVNIVFDV